MWKARVADYRASGQTAAEWCVAHQVTTQQLRYWMRKYKDGDQNESGRSSQWVAVNMDEQPSKTESTIRVMVGSVSIEVRSGFNPSLLFDVVKALQSLC